MNYPKALHRRSPHLRVCFCAYKFYSSGIRGLFFPTLAVELLDFKVYVVLAAVLNGNVFLQCPPQSIRPAAEYPCSAQVPNRRVCLQCPTAQYPCSAQPQSIPAVPDCRVCLQCPTAEYPCSALPQSMRAVPNRRVPAVPNHQVCLQCPTAEFPQSSRKLYISCPIRALGWGCSK